MPYLAPKRQQAYSPIILVYTSAQTMGEVHHYIINLFSKRPFNL